LSASDVTRPDARSRLRRRLIVATAVALALIFFRYAFATMRTVGWGGWPLALLLCVLTAAACQLAVMFARPSRTTRTHTTSDEDASDHASK
jgi:fatty acid desaturase